MLMQTKSISDRSLLLAVGFFSGPTGPDIVRISAFCGVSERTAKRWLKHGLPRQARAHFENLLNGDYLPAAWRLAGLKVAADCIYGNGYKVPLDVVRYWPFLCRAVDWQKAVIPRP
jgi:hypothetical protein